MTSAPPPRPERSPLALGLSVLLPGLGHAILGRGRRGALWLLAMVFGWVVVTVMSAWWLGALALGAGVWTLWYVACAIDAYRQPKTESTTMAWLAFAGASALAWTIAPIGLSVAIRIVALEAFKVPAGSMCPTFEVGDHFFLDKTAYRGADPARGEIVVYSRVLAGGSPTDFVHRIVAVGGDEVTVEKGRVTVNGKSVPATPTGASACGGEVFDETLGGIHRIAVDATRPADPAAVHVPPGELFLLGDNRSNSADSRFFGTVPRAAVKGRAWKIWFRSGGATWRDVH